MKRQERPALNESYSWGRYEVPHLLQSRSLSVRSKILSFTICDYAVTYKAYTELSLKVK